MTPQAARPQRVRDSESGAARDSDEPAVREVAARSDEHREDGVYEHFAAPGILLTLVGEIGLAQTHETIPTQPGCGSGDRMIS